MISLPTHKPQLRRAAIARRQALSEKQRSDYSLRIVQRLEAFLNDRSDHAVLAYRSQPDEVDTAALFDDLKQTLYAPRMEADQHLEWHRITADSAWKRGPFGILEPVGGPLWQADDGPAIILCPLTAFDRSGNRLGMGKGFFDRWLAAHRQGIAHIIGLAFSCQEFELVPAEPHDIPLDIVISENEVITCQNA